MPLVPQMPHFVKMNNQFKYQLSPGSKKYYCPGCGKKRFVRYVDTSTGELLPEQFGRCDRAVNCGYHLNPYREQYGKDQQSNWTPPPPEPPKPASYISPEILKASLQAYEQNNFVMWLNTFLDNFTVKELTHKFRIGTSKHWPGATVFWQIDNKGRIRSGKIMLYDQATGKRIKKPYNHITWSHKAMKLENFNLKQCYFGLHQLISEPGKPIAIVESEKTAIIASAYLPKFSWLACGSLTNLSEKMFVPLASKKVVLYPDLNAFDKWQQKADELRVAYPGTKIIISELLEKHCTQAEKENGFDLADYLTKYSVKSFQKPEERLTGLIRQQFKIQDLKWWIIDPDKFPDLTRYNLEVLTNELNTRHNLQITPGEYLESFYTYLKTKS